MFRRARTTARTHSPVAALTGAVALTLLMAACGSDADQADAASATLDDASADAAAASVAPDESAAAEPVELSTDQINLDYAYYNPASLVLRDQGLIEAAVGPDVEVTWTLSAGSNKANEALRGSVVDFGSTAGGAALVARANGSPIKTIDVLGLPEWGAIVVPADSTITDVEGLRGATIAATIGTDPYFFLLQTLADAGLSLADVEVVNLQHADGRTALIRGDVDAWAGLDPIMADAEITDGATLLVRDPARLSYSVLNTREDFLADHPDAVEVVLAQYAAARDWIAENPDETAALLAKESGVALPVAEKVLTERTDLTVDPVPGDDLRAVLERIIPIVVAEAQVPDEATATTALDTLFAPELITSIAAGTR